MTEQWLSIVEYARTYQVSDMTVRRRIKTGKLHAILQDGKYFIPTPTPTPTPGHEGRGSSVNPSAESREGVANVQPMVTPRHQSQHLAYHQAPTRPKNHEITASKNHPQVHAGFQASKPSPTRASSLPEDGDGVIPNSLRRALSAEDLSLVDSRALLAYCEASLRKLAEGERRTVERFKSKLEALEAALAQRDFEIKTLRQQAEDLQLLVKILEKRK